MPPRDVVERVSFAEFLERFVWQQGEHITAVGPTGSGKTTLMVQLLHRRQFVTALGTKPADNTLMKLIRKEKHKLIRAWPPPPIAGRREQRVVLWPAFRKPEDMANQQIQIDRALREMFTQGGWTVFADELYYLCHMLRLTKLLETYWTQGRSIGLSLVGGTQRPAHVPLFAYSQCTHLFAWKSNDERDLRRIGGLGGISAKQVQETIMSLAKHEVLYINTRDGEMMRFFPGRG
ncbi:hypothetical protein ACIA8O_39845 [Kitasatospora sp. NPDC051853]|uniref:hypothetical protein n=1 Tax=Kitasatospora sp. NPDC051853 TaxID=3364058 RepID=UPI0037A7F5FF